MPAVRPHGGIGVPGFTLLLPNEVETPVNYSTTNSSTVVVYPVERARSTRETIAAGWSLSSTAAATLNTSFRPDHDANIELAAPTLEVAHA